MQESSSSESRPYYPQLDGLRFFAFLIVFIGHIPRSNDDFGRIQTVSWAGVDLFYMLSAFLLTRLAMWEWRVEKQFSIRNFFIRRCLRIWPLYYLVVLLAFFVLPNVPIDLESTRRIVPEELYFHLPFALTFTANLSLPLWASSSINVYGPMWSVCTEEQFYLLFPLLILFLMRRSRILPATVMICCLGILMTLFFRYVLLVNFQPWTLHFIYSNLPTRLEPFLAGLLLAILVEKGKLPKWTEMRFAPSILFILGLILLSLVATGPDSPPFSAWEILFVYTTVTVGFFMIFTAVLNGPKLRSLFSCAPFMFLGQITYGLYVFHPTVVSVVMQYLPEKLHRVEIVGPPSLLATIAIAYVSNRFFERPFLKLKRKFNRRQSTVPADPAEPLVSVRA